MNNPLRIIGLTCLLVGVLCLVMPIVCGLFAGAISTYYGVPCTEAGPEVIIFCGEDIGELVYEIAMMPWFLIFTIPVAAFLLPLGCVVMGMSCCSK